MTQGEDEEQGLDCFLRMELKGKVWKEGRPRKGERDRILEGRCAGLRRETETVSVRSPVWRRKAWGNLRRTLVRAGVAGREGRMAGRSQDENKRSGREGRGMSENGRRGWKRNLSARKGCLQARL